MGAGDLMTSIKNMKGKGILAACLVLGVALALVGLFWPTDAGGRKNDSDGEITAYTQLLEERIRALCVAVDGVDSATVLLTLEGGSEYVYAKDGSSTGTSVSETYLVINGENSEKTVKVTEITPKVRGVAIVCTRGDDPGIKMKLTSLISAALGIPSSRIEIASGS